MCEKLTDGRRDVGGVGLQGEVTGVEEADDRVGNIALEGLGARRQEERVVLTPHREQWGPVRAEVLVEFGYSATLLA